MRHIEFNLSEDISFKVPQIFSEHTANAIAEFMVAGHDIYSSKGATATADLMLKPYEDVFRLTSQLIYMVKSKYASKNANSHQADLNTFTHPDTPTNLFGE